MLALAYPDRLLPGHTRQSGQRPLAAQGAASQILDA